MDFLTFTPKKLKMNKLNKIVNVTVKNPKTFVFRGMPYSLLNIKYKVLFKN